MTRIIRYFLIVGGAMASIVLFLLASAAENSAFFDQHYPWLLGLNALIAISLLVLGEAPSGQEGAASASLQLGENLGATTITETNSGHNIYNYAPGLVADGRDMGTIVFRDAPFKFFLTASAAERARRRYKQLKEKGLTVTLAALLREIEARDERDATRKVAPLKPAEGAVIIDSTAIPIDEVIARVLAVVRPA